MKSYLRGLLGILLTFMLVGRMFEVDAAVLLSAHEKFSDVEEGAWYEETLNRILQEGIIDGYPDGTFKGENEMQRDQFIKTMVVAIDGEQELGDEYWASEYIDRAIELGIIDEDTFEDYTEMVTRGEMALVAENALVLLEGEYDYNYTQLIINTEIEDLNDLLHSDYTTSISRMYEQGILLGYPDGEYKPYNGLKRQEAITVILRVIDESYRQHYGMDVTYDFSDFPEEIQEAIEVIGATPYLTEDGEILTVENASEVCNNLGSIFMADGYDITIDTVNEYTTDEYYSFDMTIDLADIVLSEYSEEMMSYKLYMIEKHLKEFLYLEDEAIEAIQDIIVTQYYRVIEFKETLEYDGTRIGLEVLDPYGRTLLVLDMSNLSGEINIRGLYPDGNPYK